MTNVIKKLTRTLRWLIPVVWHLVLLVVVLFTSATVLLAVGTFFDPATSRYTMMSSNVWITVGPHFVLLSLIALLVCTVAMRYGPWRLSVVAAVIAVVGLLASTTITTWIVFAVRAAGGSANPLTGLRLSSMAEGTTPNLRETYTTFDGRHMSAAIYRSAGTTVAPVMMYIHGGGWILGGTDGRDLRWFADRGWVVISVQYHLATETEPTWDKVPRDLACALGWVGKNASRLGGDPGRLVIAGDSAGGNLAINLAYMVALGKLEACGGTLPLPSAVVVTYPAVDPQSVYDHGFPALGVEPQMFIRRYIGGEPGRFPDRMRAISSATYLSRHAPPTLIIEPENDGLVNSPSVYHFVDQARDAGVEVTLARIPFANHDFDSRAANSLGNQARLSIVQRYLARRGFLQVSRVNVHHESNEATQ